jgi:purine-binding chemotaxis protein CheW
VVAAHAAMLVTRVGELTCGFPIEHVVETLRPLPIEPMIRSADPALASIAGLARIRGAAVPVVDARALLGVSGPRATRFVVVRSADRRIALAVDAVIDVRSIELGALARLPPLLAGAHRDSVSAIGAHDAGLLVILDAARVLSEDSWRAIDHAGPDRGHP